MIYADPKNADHYLKYGELLCLTKNYRKEIKALTKSVKLSPGNPIPLYHLANVYYIIKDYSAAIEHYRKSLLLDQTNAQCHFNIGSAFSAIKMFTFAIKHYKISIELNP